MNLLPWANCKTALRALPGTLESLTSRSGSVILLGFVGDFNPPSVRMITQLTGRKDAAKLKNRSSINMMPRTDLDRGGAGFQQVMTSSLDGPARTELSI
jgi:hypothetical protein